MYFSNIAGDTLFVLGINTDYRFLAEELMRDDAIHNRWI